MKEVLEEVGLRCDRARAGGGTARIEAQHKRGKLTARERIEILLDEGSFEEYGMYVEHRCIEFGMDQKYPRRWRGHRLGHHQRPHRLCFLQGLHRVRRLAVGGPRQEDLKIQDMAMQNGAPVIGLFNAGGARIQEGVAALGGYAEIFLRTFRARASSRRSA